MSAWLLEARTILPASDESVLDGGLLVDGGVILRVLRSRAAVRRAAREVRRREDLADLVLTPGLVNAHAHLELSGLVGRMPRGGEFGGWVRRLLEQRSRRSASELAADARHGADRCLASGTTWVGDIDSTGAAEHGLARHALQVRLYREVLDAQDPARTPVALARIARALPRRARMLEGIAPHAPYSVSPELLCAVSRLAQRRRLPVSLHWSETEAEVQWLDSGTGALAALLGTSPLRSGLDLLEQAGLLGPATSLVHGNHPARGELARLASAGVTVVHCPGSHQWFDREPFEVSAYQRAGVQLALGSDSLASNEELDLLREMALVRSAHPQLDPRQVWSWATHGGARALGLSERAGQLVDGRPADLVAWSLSDQGGDPLDALTSGRARAAAVWIAGRRAWRVSATGAWSPA